MNRVRKAELKRHSLTTLRFPGRRILSKFQSKLLAKLLLASSWDFLAKGFLSNCFKTFASFFPSPPQLKTLVSSFPSISAPPTAVLTKELCCGISLEGSRRKRAAVAKVAKVAKCTFSQFSTLDASHTHPEHFWGARRFWKAVLKVSGRARQALSRSSHLALHNLHFSVNWHSALYSPSSAS